MGLLTRRRNPFSRELVFVQSSQRSAAPGWPTESGSRSGEVGLVPVRHTAERKVDRIRRAVAMLYSNRCMSRRRELALTRRRKHDL